MSTPEDYMLMMRAQQVRDSHDPDHFYKHIFMSLPEIADAVEKTGGPCQSGVYDDSRYAGEAGGKLLDLARYGWTKHEAEAMDVADAAVRMVERECDQFIPTFEVTGDEIDMGRYMAGLPEDMVDYPLMRVSNVGSVVTLYSDNAVTASVSNAAILRRGLTIAGLAMALNRLGHSTEIWVGEEFWTYKRMHERCMVRTRVKGTNDFIDPSAIMFAFCHPGMQRGLQFAVGRAEGGYDGQYGKDLWEASMGGVNPTTRDLPEGTIYMPPMFRDSDAPNAQTEMRRYLQQLNLIQGDDD